MKKKLTAFMLAVSMLFMLGTAFAQEISVRRDGNTRAVLMCYDEDGALVYSKLLKSADGVFNTDIPARYENTEKKLYFVDTAEFKLPDEVLLEPEATEQPAATDTPAETAAPAKPAKTAEPAKTPIEDTPYEREADEVYAPAMVVDVSTTSKDGDEFYTLETYYLGKKVTVDVDTDIKIGSAPDEYSYMKGKTANSLKKGDVVWMTANLGGDVIRTIDFITRPPEEDIVTSGADYGNSFEKLFASNGLVAGRFTYLEYGKNTPTEKYQYAYGIIGRIKGTNLTLLGRDGVIDDALSIGVNPKAYVYTCDVSGRDYEFNIGDISDITTQISQKEFRKDAADLNADYSYNYALVRMVNGTATDIVIFENYND